MLDALNQIASMARGGQPGGIAATEISGTVVNRADREKPKGAPFSDLLTDAVSEVGSLEGNAKKSVVGLMTGTGVDVHQAMIATEKASMAFEMSLAVRNKVVQAYQQVMSMQF